MISAMISTMIDMRVCLLALLVLSCNGIANHGMLLTIPLPFSPPPVIIALPHSVPPAVISSLELTNNLIRKLTYHWSFTADTSSIVSSHLLTFDWHYQGQSGFGYFQEDHADFTFGNQFTTDQHMRFVLQPTEKTLKPGQVKVTLGGNVKETLAVEIVNLVTNHASLLFRKAVAGRIAEAISSLSKLLHKDPQLVCLKKGDPNTCIYINTTLTTIPITNSHALFIPINAAPYSASQPNSSLNPPDVLVWINSTHPQLQVHGKMLIALAELYFNLRGNDLVISTMNITTVVDIDSFSLSPLFPPMSTYQPVRDVILDVKLEKITQNFQVGNLVWKFKGSVLVQTEIVSSRTRMPYLLPANISLTVKLEPIFGHTALSWRVTSAQITELMFDSRDVESGQVVPEQLKKYMSVLVSWATDAVNFDLNRELIRLQFQGNEVQYEEKLVGNYGYCFDFLIKTNQVAMKTG